MTKEFQMTNDGWQGARARLPIRHFSLIIPSSFVVRHSSFTPPD